MRFAMLKGERNLSDLVGRLFQIKGPRAKALAREAEAALLRDNPHLRHLRTVPEGTVIVVPDVADVNPAEEARPVGDVAGEMIGKVRRALDAFRPALEASITRQTEEATKTLELLKSEELVALARKEPALKERLPKIAEEATARLKEAKALKTVHEQALAQIQRDLDDLIKRLT